jgi:hypothetical protein
MRRNSGASPENKRCRNLKLQASRTIDLKLMRHTHHFHSVTSGSLFSPNRPYMIRIDFKSDEDLNYHVGGECLTACIIDQLRPCFVSVRDFENNSRVSKARVIRRYSSWLRHGGWDLDGLWDELHVRGFCAEICIRVIYQNLAIRPTGTYLHLRRI